MKILSLFLALALALASTPSLASTFGPVKPLAEPGHFSAGVGLFHHTGNLEFDDDLVDGELDQTRFFVQGSYAISEASEIYARLGGSDLEYDGSFVGEGSLDADAAPFGSVGFKGPVYSGKNFDLGFFAEGSFFGSYDEETTIGATEIDIEVDPSWQADVGLTFQKEIEGAYLYGGPILYYRTGDVTAKSGGVEVSDGYEEEGLIGGFLGAHWAMKNGVNVQLETQFKSEISFGVAVSYAFR